VNFIRVDEQKEGEEYRPTIGKLIDVTETGANQVYHIRFDDQSVQLIPAIPQVVISINLEEGKMEIRPLPGLFDDREAVEA
jgi:16S rRNA processing protein RimM